MVLSWAYKDSELLAHTRIRLGISIKILDAGSKAQYEKDGGNRAILIFWNNDLRKPGTAKLCFQALRQEQEQGLGGGHVSAHAQLKKALQQSVEASVAAFLLFWAGVILQMLSFDISAQQPPFQDARRSFAVSCSLVL